MPKLIDEICPKCGANYTTSYYDEKTIKGKTLWRHECGSCGFNTGDFKSQDDAADAWEMVRNPEPEKKYMSSLDALNFLRIRLKDEEKLGQLFDKILKKDYDSKYWLFVEIADFAPCSFDLEAIEILEKTIDK